MRGPVPSVFDPKCPKLNFGVSQFRIWTHIGVMPHLDTCLGTLRRLIARGDLNGIPLAERAINEYWDATPKKARKSGLRLIQQDVLDQWNAVFGDQRNFAETVNADIEKKLEAE